ncbi:MAG: hypothetical protein U1F68_07795 [Gammaproteobacteria bacterium]
MKWFQRLAPALALVLCAPALAQARERLDTGDIAVEVVTDYGRNYPQYPVERDRRVYRAYLEARENDEYGVRIYNRSRYRIGVVVAVDGRNIISGERSELQPSERMYILGPHESALYNGWRTGKNQVNRFYFTEAGDSYSAAWGDYSAMGVIAVAAFKERVPVYEPRPDQDLSRRSDKRAAPGARAEPGTGFGEEEYSPSRQVEFLAEDRAFARYFLKYEWREGLCEKNVIRCHREHEREPDNRFWNDDRYAPPPPRR